MYNVLPSSSSQEELQRQRNHDPMEEVLIIDDSKQICAMLADYILPELGYAPIVTNSGRQGLERLRQRLPDLILLDLQLPDMSGLDLLRLIAQEGYDVPVILMTAHGSEAIAVEAFRLGARNYLIKPFSEVEAQGVINTALRERRLARERDMLLRHLRQRVQELTVLSSIGKSVSSLLDLEELLVRIVEAGVYITRAEEGFLLLRDSNANELYLRAAKNLGEQRAQRLRLPINDGLAGQVVRTGKPIRMDRATKGSSLKVKTGFLVRAILQVPLTVGDMVIGVLAVDNQQNERAFSENDQYLLSTLADYAAIAIENARLYQQIKRSEERYRDLFADANDVIFTLDKNLYVQSINKAGMSLLNKSSEHLCGSSFEELCLPESWLTARLSFDTLFLGQSVPPFELQLRPVGDKEEVIIIEVSGRLVNEADQGPIIHCIARNMTDRRRLEQQLLRSEKLSAIGQLVAGVAHELNNPLTSISGFTQLLLRDNTVVGQVRDDLKQIGTQAERAAKIVQNLLVFAREHKPQRMVVDVNEVIKSTLILRAYQLRVDNVQVVLELDTKLPLTIADPFQLQQVFLNLINNAHQAMVEREVPGVLTIRTTASEDLPTSAAAAGIPSIRIAISDTGVGIAPELLNKVFDPFFTTKPVGQGTGLGLSICYGIIHEHSGRIWVESTPGVGATLFVELPIVSENTANTTTNPLPDVANDGPKPQHCHILVVDDEEAVGGLLSRLLRDLNHIPTYVNNGLDAINLINQERFDLVLSDVKMPGMSGFDLYDAIYETNAELASRIIFITGDTLTSSTQARIARLGNPNLAKPFSIDRLETAVSQMLAKRRPS